MGDGVCNIRAFNDAVDDGDDVDDNCKLDVKDGTKDEDSNFACFMRGNAGVEVL